MNYNINLPTHVPMLKWNTDVSYVAIQGAGIRCQMTINVNAGGYAQGKFDFIGVFRTSDEEELTQAECIERARSAEAASLLYDVAVRRIRESFSEDLLFTLLPDFPPNPYI